MHPYFLHPTNKKRWAVTFIGPSTLLLVIFFNAITPHSEREGGRGWISFRKQSLNHSRLTSLTWIQFIISKNSRPKRQKRHSLTTFWKKMGIISTEYNLFLYHKWTSQYSDIWIKRMDFARHHSLVRWSYFKLLAHTSIISTSPTVSVPRDCHAHCSHCSP